MTVRRPQKSEHGDAAEAPGQAYKNDIGSTAPTKKHNYQLKRKNFEKQWENPKKIRQRESERSF